MIALFGRQITKAIGPGGPRNLDFCLGIEQLNYEDQGHELSKCCLKMFLIQSWSAV